MSEFQLYEWMAVDKPLTKAQQDAVESLSSHMEVSPTYATVEYSWGDFKHEPVKVLQKYFDGFLYQANWGYPHLALRFPHGSLPADLLEDYDFDDFVTFTKRSECDILEVRFDDVEGDGSDEWIGAKLSSLISVREELLAGDFRSLYILWLACQEIISSYEEEDGYEDDDDDDESQEEDEIAGPRVPAGLEKLTAAQRALAHLYQVPEEMLLAAARHSSKTVAEPGDDFAAWITLLPPARRDDYLLRLADNEPGLSRLFVRELRELGRGKSSVPAPSGERVSFATLASESSAIHAQLERARREHEAEQERKKREQARLARERRLQEMHGYQETYWNQAEKEAARGTAHGYDAATQLLVDLRDSAKRFDESEAFRERFLSWIRPHLRRPALLNRLRANKFPVPE